MTGQEFKAGIVLDKRSIGKIAELLQVDRTTVYWIYKQKTVPDKYVRRAKAFDVYFPCEEIDALKKEISELKLKILSLENSGINRRRKSNFVKNPR